MTSFSDEDLWQREHENLSLLRTKNPEGFSSHPQPKEVLLQRIGVYEPPPSLPLGYIKYSPFDFIVEEITPDGSLVSVDQEALPANPDGTGTIYADLVKIGLGTLDAVNRIASALTLEPNRIGYAGIKDAMALTSQRISIRGTSLDAVRSISPPSLFLKNIFESKGALNVGSLSGNRFTLFIRTEKPIDGTALESRLNSIHEKGIINYYGAQRFGSPRFLSHVFGKYVLEGNVEKLIEIYLTQTTAFEWPFVSSLREHAKRSFGSWAAMREIFSALPYTFRHECALLSALEGLSPTDCARAFIPLSKQVDLWARAYASFLANRALSDIALGKQERRETIPLLLSFDPSARSFYAAYSDPSLLNTYLQNVRRLFPFIHIAPSSTLPTAIFPKFHGTALQRAGVALSFDLPKGAYATTVLGALFDVQSGLPTPSWVQNDEVDSKSLLGTGTVQPLRDQFTDVLRDIMSRKKEFGE